MPTFYCARADNCGSLATNFLFLQALLLLHTEKSSDDTK